MLKLTRFKLENSGAYLVPKESIYVGMDLETSELLMKSDFDNPREERFFEAYFETSDVPNEYDPRMGIRTPFIYRGREHHPKVGFALIFEDTKYENK